MKSYVKLNFQRLLLAGFSKLRSGFPFLGSIWKFIMQNTPVKQVEMENHNEESSHSVEKNSPSGIFTIGKNTSMYSLFNELTCAKFAKKTKSIFAIAWHSCRNESEQNWKVLLLKLISLHILFSKNYKKFEMQRNALDLQTVAEKQRSCVGPQLKFKMCRKESYQKKHPILGKTLEPFSRIQTTHDNFCQGS